MKKVVLLFLFTLAASVSFDTGALAASPFKNIKQIETAAGFTSYYGKIPVKRLRIAVFDRGFHGFQEEIGKTLPADTQFHPGPLKAPDGSDTPHGLAMAQLLTALMTDEGKASAYTPELHLYNVFGFTNFRAAIDDVISKHFDLILHSEVWDYGSNFDGHGFFNHEVDRAAQAGIIWVNAAGNFAQGTYNGPIRNGSDNWLVLPDRNQSVALRCQPPASANALAGTATTTNARSQKCLLRLVLSWNDFKDDVNAGTSKDLDVALFDDMMNMVQSSQLKQVVHSESSQTESSLYPREILTAELNPGLYYIKIKDRSQNFTQTDRLRISVSGEFLYLNHTQPHESLLNPADNPHVVTVGAWDSDRSSDSARLQKPELTAQSSVMLGSNEEFRGSSNAAAIVTAGFGILKSLLPALSQQDLLQLSSSPMPSARLSLGLPTSRLGFVGTGLHGCFEQTQAEVPAQMVQAASAWSGAFVNTTAGVKLMVAFDPGKLLASKMKTAPDDIVTVSANGVGLYPRTEVNKLSSRGIEVFQTPIDKGLCGTPTSPPSTFGRPGMNARFRLPVTE